MGEGGKGGRVEIPAGNVVLEEDAGAGLDDDAGLAIDDVFEGDDAGERLNVIGEGK